MPQYDPVTGLPMARRPRRQPQPTVPRFNPDRQPSPDGGGPTIASYGTPMPPPPEAFSPEFKYAQPAGYGGVDYTAPLTSPYASYGNYTPPNLTGATAAPPPGAGNSLLLSAAFTPDYQALVQNDPAYQQYQRDLDAQTLADQASLRSARQRAVALFGEVPTGVDLGSDITPETLTLAQQNTAAGLSTLAQLQRQADDSRRDVINQLAARGLLRSGETGYQLGRADDAYRQAQFQARDAITSYLNAAATGYANAQNQRAQARTNALQQAASYQATLPQNQPRAERRAYLDPNGSGLYYEAETGLWYSPDGTPSPPPPTATQPVYQPYPVAPTPTPPAPRDPGLGPFPAEPSVPGYGTYLGGGSYQAPVGGPTAAPYLPPAPAPVIPDPVRQTLAAALIGAPAPRPTPRPTLNRRYRGNRPG